jgi:hypothetical protein
MYHGGQCCGVKTIAGFWLEPDYVLVELAKIGNEGEKYRASNKDKRGVPVSSEDSVYNEGAPSETCFNRVKRYVDYLEKHRPMGLVEAYLIDTQKEMWHKSLRKLGFKEVSQFKNSNTGRVITLYHLYTGDAKVVKKRRTPVRKAPVTPPPFINS